MDQMKQAHSDSSFTVMVIDDFQNKIIGGNDFSLLMDGNKPTAIEKDRRQIFTVPHPGVHNLSIEGRNYQKQNMEIDPDEEKTAGGGVLKVRLQPNRSYPLGEKARVLTGAAAPDRELHFMFINQKESYRLEKDYRRKETVIAIGRQTGGLLDGALFGLQKADGAIEEFWIEGESGTAKGQYRMRYALKNDYESGKCILRRIYPVITDRDGNFFLPVPAAEDGSEEYRYYSPLDKQSIVTGQINQ